MEEVKNNEIKLTVEECPISSVTVYKDRADVARSIETSVKAGINELRVSGFVAIDEDSIRVEGKGKAIIAEVSFQSKWCTEDEASMSDKEKALTEELKTLKEEQKVLDANSQLNLLKKQWTVLDGFAVSAAKGGKEQEDFKLDETYFKGMKDFIQQFGDLGKEFNARKLDVENKSEELAEKIAQIENNLREVRGNKQKSSQVRECIIVLEASEETPVQLKLSYIVFNASWKPSYDLRMNTEDGILKVSYFGLISQHTGEDWANVKIHLSTAEPGVGGIIPVVPQTQISVEGHYRFAARAKSFGRSSSNRRFRSLAANDAQLLSASLDVDDVLERGMALDSLQPMASGRVEVHDSTISTSYEIARQSTIPSDNTHHKVTVGIIELKPTMTYVSVPKVVPHAFLQAKVVNTSQFTFLPGTTNIFMDNSFVTKAELKAVAPKEEFECSLGVDPGVRVTYKPLVRVNSSSGIFSKVKVISHEQAIEVKNVHGYPVKVTVKDNLPRSLDDKIKVTLQSPHIDANHPEKGEATLNTENTVQWEIEVKALGKQDLLLKYTVEHPPSESLSYRTV